ncbi:MAG: PQQ-binding-like beta-propeller repeat protein [Gemmataceae bacterium]
MKPDFKPRIAPAFFILALIVIAAFVPRFIAPRTIVHFGGMVGGWVLSILATFIWWTFFSGIRGWMRWLPPMLFLIVVGTAAAFYPNPMLAGSVFVCAVAANVCWLLGAIVSYRLGRPAMKKAVPLALLVALAAVFAIRIDGTDAEIVPELSARWTKTAEQLAMESRSHATTSTVESVDISPSDWPQFRGRTQDSRVVGMTIRTDWTEHPPQEIWRKRIGPGWGTFSVVGDHLYTQEQRGPNEAVVCLKADSGDEVWAYETPARHDDGNAGTGPRATPTVSNGSVFAFGATGILTRLDQKTGKKIWEVDIPKATGTQAPRQFWGYASSPYVDRGLVVVFINGGASGKGTAAFKVEDGSIAWTSGAGKHGYCTAHRATICGVDQILMANDQTLEAYDLPTGKILWSHAWPVRSGNRSTQPILLGNDEILFTSGYGIGTRKLKITKSGDAWNVATVWEAKTLKPYYNDAVFHNGLIFGFDDSAFVCLDPANGKIKWNEGAVYGFGQVLLLADQNLLLVMAENGTVALVRADGREYEELARFKAFDGKKTWNHPVVNRGKLYVRNGAEMACYDLGTR